MHCSGLSPLPSCKQLIRDNRTTVPSTHKAECIASQVVFKCNKRVCEYTCTRYECNCVIVIGFISVDKFIIRIPNTALNTNGFRNPDNSDLSG